LEKGRSAKAEAVAGDRTRNWPRPKFKSGRKTFGGEEEGTGEEKVEGEEIGDWTYLSRSSIPCIAKTDGWSPVNQDPAHVHVNESRMHMEGNPRFPFLVHDCRVCLSLAAPRLHYRRIGSSDADLRAVSRAAQPIALASAPGGVLLCSITYHPADLPAREGECRTKGGTHLPHFKPRILLTREDHALSLPKPPGCDAPVLSATTPLDVPR
jgi:hypothetical protein